MIKMISKLLVAVLFIESIAVSKTQAAENQPQQASATSSIVVRMLRDEVAAHPDFYKESKISEAEESMMNKTMVLSEVEKMVARLKDTSEDLATIKEDILKQAIEEEEAQGLELNRVLLRMSIETLDAVFEESVKTSNYSKEAQSDYRVAFNADEKRKVILQMAREDLSRIRSITMKRLAIMDRDGILRELEQTKSFLNVKGKDQWLLVAVIVLSVAASGFLGWAIVKGVKNRYVRKSKELDQEYADKFDAAHTEYLNKEQDLVNYYKERERLREEGYVWTICNTEHNSKTVSCSYDYRTYSGSETCVTRCLKNPKTGDSVFPSKQCTSAYIPNNCLQMNPYEKGYYDGYGNGKDDGYHDGYADYYWKGYDDYYPKGYDQGFYDGFDDGYADGFFDGYRQAEFDAASKSASSKKGYSKGYLEGYSQASTMMVH